MTRETTVTDTFVELADTLVDNFDVTELLTVLTSRAVELLSIAAAGVLLAAPDDTLQVVASSSEQARVIEVFELQHDQGPCVDCYRTGNAIVNESLVTTNQWPEFTPAARNVGFVTVTALPLRYRSTTIGALNLFDTGPPAMTTADQRLAQALANVATISILQQRAADESDELNTQLQTALQSRVVIEQAKGALAEAADVDMDSAFSALRAYARNNNQRLADVAAAVAARTLDPADVVVNLANPKT